MANPPEERERAKREQGTVADLLCRNTIRQRLRWVVHFFEVVLQPRHRANAVLAADAPLGFRRAGPQRTAARSYAFLGCWTMSPRVMPQLRRIMPRQVFFGKLTPSCKPSVLQHKNKFMQDYKPRPLRAQTWTAGKLSTA